VSFEVPDIADNPGEFLTLLGERVGHRRGRTITYLPRNDLFIL
jgi:hypothetical protein